MTRQVVLWLWALAAALVVGCQVVALVVRSRFAGFRKVLDLVSSSSIGLVVVFVGWMWLGWHFFAR